MFWFLILFWTFDVLFLTFDEVIFDVLTLSQMNDYDEYKKWELLPLFHTSDYEIIFSDRRTITSRSWVDIQQRPASNEQTEQKMKQTIFFTYLQVEACWPNQIIVPISYWSFDSKKNKQVNYSYV